MGAAARYNELGSLCDGATVRRNSPEAVYGVQTTMECPLYMQLFMLTCGRSYMSTGNSIRSTDIF